VEKNQQAASGKAGMEFLLAHCPSMVLENRGGKKIAHQMAPEHEWQEVRRNL
jgi:hypothetical protein